MRCLLCRNLEQAFEARRREYIEAGSLAFYSVSTKFAAYKNVEMERALNELLDHRSVCRSAVSELSRLPVVAMNGPVVAMSGIDQRDVRTIGSVETAA
jgi:hypothetical protein